MAHGDPQMIEEMAPTFVGLYRWNNIPTTTTTTPKKLWLGRQYWWIQLKIVSKIVRRRRRLILNSCAQLLIQSFIHSFNHSLSRSVGCLLLHPFTRLFRSINLFSLSHLLNNCFFLFPHSLTRSSIQPSTHSLTYSFIHSFIHSLIHSFTHFIHTLQVDRSHALNMRRSWLLSKAAIARENTQNLGEWLSLSLFFFLALCLSLPQQQ